MVHEFLTVVSTNNQFLYSLSRGINYFNAMPAGQITRNSAKQHVRGRKMVFISGMRTNRTIVRTFQIADRKAWKK